jgi:predicted peptidase
MATPVVAEPINGRACLGRGRFNNSWSATYENPEVLDWLFEQKK